MSQRLTVLPRLLAVIGLLMLTALAVAPASQGAEPWGDLGHFGNKTGELTAPEHAFGVNPEDGSVWTVDTVVNGGNEEFRIQQFKQEGGALKKVAELPFRATEIAEPEAALTVEGIAFDTTLHRAYVLVTEERSSEEQAAGELWAFSTTTSGGKIAPATGTKAGVLVEASQETKLKGGPIGQTKFAPLDKESGQALIEPSGIAVNPTTSQVVITGYVNNEVPAAWAVSKEGKIEAAWMDKEKKESAFENCGCLGSPVVTSSGQILALAEGKEEELGVTQVWELPSNLSPSVSAKRSAIWLPTSTASCEELQREKEKNPEVELCPFVEHLNLIDSGQRNEGGEMAIGPEGNIYISSKIPLFSDGENPMGDVLVFNAKFEEIGWTGGGNETSETKACSVNETAPENGGTALIGAGKEQVYMLAPSEKKPEILELGTGGSTTGCPKGSATPPTATAGGVPLSAFPLSDTITFSSKVEQANALSTEWEFEEGVKETVNKRQQGTTVVEHKFAKAGEFTVHERIHSDDLATPVIEVTKQVTILGAPKVTAEEAVVEGGSVATLKAEVNPEAQKTTVCEFQYGPAAEAFTGAGTKKVSCPKPVGEGKLPVPESVQVTTLTAGTEYHFRVVATNTTGTTEPLGTKFTMPAPGAPVAETEAATGVATATATLNGKVNPEGTETKCKFEYGTTTASGKEVPCGTAPGAGSGLVAVSAALGGLAANTTYHFRLVAENAKGQKALGAELVLKTTAETVKPPPPGPPSTPPGPTGGGSPPPPPGGGVKGVHVELPPAVTIAGASLTVSSSGGFSLKLSCPAEEAQCSGTVTLKTLTAVAASSASSAKAKKSILTLASASFTIAGGKLKVLSLHLSAKAKKLLAKVHTVRARVTILARNPQGVAHTSTALVTFRAAKKHH